MNRIIIINKQDSEDMLKLENWGDLFKYSKELLDDDYNHGQSIVVKTKNRADDGITVSSLANYYDCCCCGCEDACSLP